MNNIFIKLEKNIVTDKVGIGEEVEHRLSVIDELESIVKSNVQRATRLRQAILQKAFWVDSNYGILILNNI